MDVKRPPMTFRFESPPHIMIVDSRFHEEVAALLLKGAQSVLNRAGATYDVHTVPGSLEIPVAISYAVKALNFDVVRRRYDGYIALGCVLKGSTNHDRIVGEESARGLQDIALRHTLAVGNAILTCDTREQALERADPGRLDRGGAAAETCLRLIELKHEFRLTPKRRWVARP